jgi:hypothetical protein
MLVVLAFVGMVQILQAMTRAVKHFWRRRQRRIKEEEEVQKREHVEDERNEGGEAEWKWTESSKGIATFGSGSATKVCSPERAGSATKVCFPDAAGSLTTACISGCSATNEFFSAEMSSTISANSSSFNI